MLDIIDNIMLKYIIMKTLVRFFLFYVFSACFVLSARSFNNSQEGTYYATASPQVAGVSVINSEMFTAVNKQRTTNEINDYRRINNQPALTEDTRLNSLAQERANDMKTKRYYSHSFEGKTFSDLLEKYAISRTAQSCENLLLTNDPATAVAQWSVSLPHKDCMLNGKMNRIGMAEVLFDEDTEQHLYVTVYASDI